MADLWDGNTYAAQTWEGLPKHIQGDIEKVLNFAGLEQRTVEHKISESVSPVSVQVRCSCGWYQSVTRKQNAFARAAKVRMAIRMHLKAVEQQPWE